MIPSPWFMVHDSLVSRNFYMKCRVIVCADAGHFLCRYRNQAERPGIWCRPYEIPTMVRRVWSETISIFSRGGSLRLVTHPKKKAATDAQEGVHGTTSGGCTSKVGNHMQVCRPKWVVSSSAWRRSKIWPIMFIALRTKYCRCTFIIVLRQFWSRGLFFCHASITKK